MGIVEKTFFDNDGFLADEVERFRIEAWKYHRELLTLIYKFNRFSQTRLRSLDVRDRDPQAVLGVLLTIKINQDLQVATRTLEIGAPIQARQLLRNALDAVVKLKAALSNHESTRQYFGSDEFKRRLYLHKAKEGRSPLSETLSRAQIDEKLDEIDKCIEELELRRPKDVEQLAHELGLGVLYETIFRLFSDSTHASPRVLTEYATFDENNRVTSFRAGPQVQDIEGELIVIINILAIMWDALWDYFKLGDPTELQEFVNQFVKITQNKTNASNEQNVAG